jgi:hypothetical protein
MSANCFECYLKQANQTPQCGKTQSLYAVAGERDLPERR